MSLLGVSLKKWGPIVASALRRCCIFASNILPPETVGFGKLNDHASTKPRKQPQDMVRPVSNDAYGAVALPRMFLQSAEKNPAIHVPTR
jgi:hypothetical protein